MSQDNTKPLPSDDELLIDELRLAIKDSKPVRGYIKAEAKRMLKVPKELATREELKKMLELKVDELIEQEKGLCDKMREIYARHGKTLKDEKVERLTSNNKAITAKKKVIEDLLCSVL